MGLAWQQGPLAPGAIGRFLVPGLLPERLLYAEPLRRRMRIRFGEVWAADSEDVVLLHEPGRHPVAYFPLGDIPAGVLELSDRTTWHRDLGTTAWYTVRAGPPSRARAAVAGFVSFEADLLEQRRAAPRPRPGSGTPRPKPARPRDLAGTWAALADQRSHYAP
jgi:hypothetical protein